MDLIAALVLSIIEGLTEFIPVSSTGHMILASWLMCLEDEAHKSFEIFIQLGAILSVVVLYPRRFLALFARSDTSALSGIPGMMRFALACGPVFVLGFLFHKMIKMYLFGPLTVACALIVGGVVMIVVERRRVSPRIIALDSISLPIALGVGVAQCFALWPGVSRSAATIIGGMMLGLDRKTAAEFSFLVAVPVMVIAVLYDLIKSAGSIHAAEIPIFAFGFLVAFLVSIVAIRFFIALLGRVTLQGFGVYRILLGCAVLYALG